MLVHVPTLHTGEQLMSRLKEAGVEVELRHESQRRLGLGLGMRNQLGGIASSTDISLLSPDSSSLGGGDSLEVQGMGIDVTADSADLSESAVGIVDPRREETDPIRLFRTYLQTASISVDDSGVWNDNGGGAGSAAKTKVGSRGNAVNNSSSDSGGSMVGIVDGASAMNVKPAANEAESRDSLQKELQRAVLAEGVSTLERLLGSASNTRMESRIHDLRLDNVSLQNFGPYGGAKVEYPLSKRGLVLITGQSSDGTGADSNGAGKVGQR